MWHVLEHLPDPQCALAKIHSLLRPDGLLFVAVPNEENQLFRNRIGLRRSLHPLGCLLPEKPSGVAPSQSTTPPYWWGMELHLTHFQPHTLREGLRRAGFETIKFGVDDLYSRRSCSNLAKLYLQKALSGLLSWHFSMNVSVFRKADA